MPKALELSEQKNDSEAALVYEWVAAMRAAGRGDEEVERFVLEPYENGFYLESDGCTLVNELGWPFRRHPACVGHDYYWKNCKGFWSGNRLLYRANRYFGRPGRGVLRWIGTTVGGWPWYLKAKREARSG